MGMGQGVRAGLGHGGITCVLQTQFPSLVFFWGWGRGSRGTCPFTQENKSLFLGNKTNVKECLIILRNKADHKKTLCLLNPFLPTYIPPYPTHFMALLGNNYSFLVLLLLKNHAFSFYAAT